MLADESAFQRSAAELSNCDKEMTPACQHCEEAWETNGTLSNKVQGMLAFVALLLRLMVETKVPFQFAQ